MHGEIQMINRSVILSLFNTKLTPLCNLILALPQL